MAAISTIAAIGLGIGAVGTIASIQQQRKAQKAQERAAGYQRANQAEQSAANEREAAIARRQQIREERIKRAQIIQAAENTGTADSSGVIGALGGMTTTLGSNLGINSGMVAQGQRISFNSQMAANFMSRAQTYQNRSGFYGQLAGVGFGIMSDAKQQARAGNKTFSLFG